MLARKIYCAFLYLTILKSYKTERRISAGNPVRSDKGYVVYLTKAPKSVQRYDYWICGGAIVSPTHIITSAACVQDVQFMYAIAGYRKYVPPQQINTDICTRRMKKKVVYTCTPRLYELDYSKIEKWAYIDIAVVRVESPFDFNDERYISRCSYRPRIIEVNYDPKYQEPKTDTIVFGWGHVDRWRTPEDKNDYNQDSLHYASTLILEKRVCKQSFANLPTLQDVIDRYMICTLDRGNLDENGGTINKTRILADGCTPNAEGELVCAEDQIIIPRNTFETLSNGDLTRKSDKSWISRIERQQQNRTRRQGICQNDHGGPLVTWVGAREELIGVASVFRVTGDSRCAGPYLYTSTQCNGLFLDCVLNGSGTGGNESRRSMCDAPPSKKGFDTEEKFISWRDHPDGPAENELPSRQRPAIRPLLPIRPPG